MSSMVQKYGKQTIKELLDLIMIKGTITNQDAFDVLLRNKHITRRTKTIDVYYGKAHQYGIKPDGTYGQLSTYRYNVNIQNGTGRYLISLYFTDDDVAQALEEIA